MTRHRGILASIRAWLQSHLCPEVDDDGPLETPGAEAWAGFKGKTVAEAELRGGEERRPETYVLRFEDGSYVRFVADPEQVVLMEVDLWEGAVA